MKDDMCVFFWRKLEGKTSNTAREDSIHIRKDRILICQTHESNDAD